MISEVDAQIGRVFDALRDSGQWNDTFIVFTSDHAEMLGDHFALGKGGFHDQSQHVPLVIRDPRAPLRGQRVEAVTEAVDIYPTLLEAMQVEPAHAPDGVSLQAWVDGRPPAGWRSAAHWEFDFRDVAGQTTERAFGRRSNELNLAVARTPKWKYVHFSSLPPLLFDLEADPDNLHNLAGDVGHAMVRAEMAEELLAWRARHLDQTLALQELTPAGVVAAPR
jgi:arylsulfatase A-like enzyme